MACTTKFNVYWLAKLVKLLLFFLLAIIRGLFTDLADETFITLGKILFAKKTFGSKGILPEARDYIIQELCEKFLRFVNNNI